MKKQSGPDVINSISELHSLLGLGKPMHPLVSIFRYEDILAQNELTNNFTLNFYCIAIKKDFGGKIKYGQNYYDFNEGVMSFISPNQLLSKATGDDVPIKGYCLIFHPDFLSGYPLMKKIKSYGYFSYEVSEALHLSGHEEELVEGILKNILNEYNSNIDQFSQDVVMAQIDLLLQYSNRFYNRQFITRKVAGKELLIRFEDLLTRYLNDERNQNFSIPSVQYISDQLHISPNYLSDMLRSLSGQSTQQHIQNKVIEMAKELLTTTFKSVSEIAYELGFEYPQSFSRLFKSKTKMSPLAYRQSFN
jgi:AraC family transcriptional activator of pobA